MTPEECVKSRIESFQARLAERNIDLAIIVNANLKLQENAEEIL